MQVEERCMDVGNESEEALLYKTQAKETP